MVSLGMKPKFVYHGLKDHQNSEYFPLISIEPNTS